MPKKYNWGIIGLGKIAQKFAQDLKVIPNARLHAVASRSANRAKAFAKLYRAPYSYGSYEEILKCPDLDVVYIATPHVLHCENTMMCLEHQIPVLCEKPFAMNAAQAKRMISLAQFQKTFLMEALWTRFLPTIEKTLELIEEGAIGELISLKADFGFDAPFDPESRLFNQNLGGGSLLDVGIYPVFLSLLLFGKPQTIKASATIGTTNVDENCGVVLKYENNQIAILDSSMVTKTATEAIINGTKGTIKINSRWHEPTSLTLSLKDGTSKDFHFDFNSNGYHYEAAAVMESLEKNQTEHPWMSLDFSLDLMELLDQIRLESRIFYPLHDQFVKTIKPGEIKFSTN